MRILVLGGTVFLSKAIATEALARQHHVTVAARGTSGSPPDGATFVRIDRSAPDGLAVLDDDEFDAVVDVARLPSQVRSALDALADRTRHWTFVSSISVYDDAAAPGRNVADTRVLDAVPSSVIGSEEAKPENYGGAKVACENAVTAVLEDHVAVLRAGLVVGPGDRSDRFTYWCDRVARGGDVLVPAPGEESVQFIDVRDLAAWIVSCAETGLTGTYDATATAISRSEMLERIATGTGSEARLVWADPDSLVRQGVNYWSGPRSLPLWESPAGAWLLSRDVRDAYDRGLRTRPVEQTAADTLGWIRNGRPEGPWKSGLTDDEEAEVLRLL